MTDTYRIVGLAGRGAVAASDGQPQSHEPFLADLVLHADREIDLATAARAAAEALARPHTTLLPRAEGVAQAVRDAVDVVSVEVTLHRPEVGLGVPVLDVELSIVRPRVAARSAGAGAGAGAGAPADAAVFAEASLSTDAGDAGAGADDGDHTARHATRAGGPFDDVLSGRGAVAPPASVTLAGITGGALAAGVPRVAGGAAAGSAAAGSAATPVRDLEPDPSATTVRTAHPAVADGLDDRVSEPSETLTDETADETAADGDEDVRAAAAAAGLAPAPHADHVFQAPPVIEPDVEAEVEAEAEAEDIAPKGVEPGYVEPDDVEPVLAAAEGEAVPPTDLPDATPSTDGPGDETAVATLPPTAMQPRRPSVDAPMPALVVLSGRGASAQNELAGAVRAIGTAAGLDVTGVSPLARTTTGGGDLHTAVVAVRTTLGPGDLASALTAVSASRPSVEAEILVVGDLVGLHDDVELPLPGVAASATVLVPWAHLDPQAILPGLGGGPVVVLAETAPDRESVRWLALDWLE
ncbi:hypothetical protein [Serinibacter arcticus]|uniref:Dihydroneopterin aldolase n=1 Tax=Serinibacter arcticus TaxID=1655435 RepID=A0A4Z1E319_9MICO|nr:hypothetical protein [Serinibacter arcticus]TGO06485.1 Dihydroneopterin aldolase [Serinibacter arcticus]